MIEDTVDRIAAAIIATGQDPWQARAQCGGQPELMDQTEAPRVWDALALCQQCPVSRECAQWVAQERDYVGVAAGKVYRTARSRGRTLKKAS